MRLDDLLAVIKRNVEHLDLIVESHGIDRVIEDYILLNATLHMLQVSIQALIDIGSVILARSGVKVPSTYSEVPKVLRQIGALDVDDEGRFRGMVGFRNVLVHSYASISINVLSKILNGRLYRNILRIAVKLVEYARSRGIDP